MKTRSLLIRVIAGALVVTAALFAAYRIRAGAGTPVDTFPAVRAPIEEIVTAVSAGTVKAVREATLSPEAMITGIRFVEVRVDAGSSVRKGELLARGVDPEMAREAEAAAEDARTAEAALRGAEARRDEALQRYRADLARAENALKQATADQRRAESLHREGFLPLSEKESVDTRLNDTREMVRLSESGAAAVQALEREIEADKSRILSARTRARLVAERERKLSIVAPFSGIITKKLVEVGETKIAGSPLFVLADPSATYIEAQIDETESARVRVGQKCRLLPDAYQGQTFEGRVSEVMPVVEASKDVSRANVIRVVAVSPPHPLRLGMSADIEVVVGRKEKTLQVPSSAIMEREGKKFVYVISDGKVARRDVATGIGNWDRTEILSGLSPGDPVVISLEQKDLAPGVRVVARRR
ncbi:MAG TPA: efflux RND transporter periplasmic adaptor subunit [Candidatus Deferrimicrobiaceae bacterium]